MVSVEWSVRGITIEDWYEIILQVTFQTNVPVAVAVLEPAGSFRLQPSGRVRSLMGSSR